jgi:BirA family biotin operon repressor/biotin-[acetyl-CoA-carboxylase] ligase
MPNPKRIQLGQIDSTNTYAKSQLSIFSQDELKSGIVITAKTQTQGRGQQNKVWVSDDEGGLYYTLVLHGKSPLPDAEESILAGQAVLKGLGSCVAIPLELEWPNDIIYGHQKVGGILIERVIRAPQTEKSPVWIIGVGINVNQSHFAPPLDKSAVSLWQITKTRYDKDKLIWAITKELYNEFAGY